jgi:hypothetical protein
MHLSNMTVARGCSGAGCSGVRVGWAFPHAKHKLMPAYLRRASITWGVSKANLVRPTNHTGTHSVLVNVGHIVPAVVEPLERGDLCV